MAAMMAGEPVEQPVLDHPCGAVGALEAVAADLQATLESTADGILVVDRDGHLAAHNARFLSMWRLPPTMAARGSDRDRSTRRRSPAGGIRPRRRP